MKKVYISVIMPAFNAGKYVREAIESVLAQSFTNFELIITDDCSTDNTLEIIRSFRDSRIRIIQNKKNKKLIKTLNNMIDIANGDFIARIDADDICKPGRFEKQIEIFSKFKDVGLCGTNAQFMDADGNIIFGGRPFFVSEHDFNHEIVYWKLFFPENPFIHSSVMIRKSILLKNNLSYNRTALHVEDIDLWIKMRDVCKLHILKEPLVFYRVIDSSISANNNDIQINRTQEITTRATHNYIGNKKYSYLNNMKNNPLILYQLFKQYSPQVKNVTAKNYILDDWLRRMVKLAIFSLPKHPIDSLNTFKILKKEKIKFLKVFEVIKKLVLNKLHYIFSHRNQYYR